MRYADKDNRRRILERHLKELTKIVEWLNGLSEGAPQIPSRMKDAPIVFGRSPTLQRIWKSIQSHVKDLDKRTRAQASALKFLESVPVGIAIVLILLGLSSPLLMFVISPYYVICLFGLLTGSIVLRESIARKIKAYCILHEVEISRVRQATQDIILYLCEKIRRNSFSTAEFRMRMKQPEYFGVKVVRYSMTSRSYIVVPSVLGAILSKARTSIKVIAHSLDTEIISALYKIPVDVHVTLILSEKDGRDYKRFITMMEKTCGTCLDVVYKDIGKEKFVILDGLRVWKCRNRDWTSLHEIFASERDDLLKRY